MAQATVLTRTGATYIGTEISFGTTPGTMIRAFPLSGSVDVSGLARTELKVEDERVRGFAHVAPIHGVRSENSAIKLEMLFRPDGTQLLGPSPSLPVNSTGLHTAMMGVLGNTSVSGGAGSFYINKGSTVVSATSSTVTVTGGHGTRFVQGQWIPVQITAGALQCVRIQSISTDTLTVWPNFSATPSAGYLVGNGLTMSPAQYHTTTLAVQHAKAVGSSVTAAQWTANGCIGDMSLTWDRGQLPRIGFELKSATHTGPSSQAISVAASSDGSGSTAGVYNAVTLFQPYATTTSTNTKMLSASVKLNLGMRFLEDLGSAEGVSGALRIPQRPVATATVKLPFDPALDTTTWDAQTPQTLVQICQIGSGLTQRFVGWELPNCVIVGKPKVTDDNGRLVTEVMLEALEDVNIGAPSSDLDYAAVRFFAL